MLPTLVSSILFCIALGIRFITFYLKRKCNLFIPQTAPILTGSNENMTEKDLRSSQCHNFLFFQFDVSFTTTREFLNVVGL